MYVLLLREFELGGLDREANTPKFKGHQRQSSARKWVKIFQISRLSADATEIMCDPARPCDVWQDNPENHPLPADLSTSHTPFSLRSYYAPLSGVPFGLTSVSVRLSDSMVPLEAYSRVTDIFNDIGVDALITEAELLGKISRIKKKTNHPSIDPDVACKSRWPDRKFRYTSINEGVSETEDD